MAHALEQMKLRLLAQLAAQPPPPPPAPQPRAGPVTSISSQLEAAKDAALARLAAQHAASLATAPTPPPPAPPSLPPSASSGVNLLLDRMITSNAAKRKRERSQGEGSAAEVAAAAVEQADDGGLAEEEEPPPAEEEEEEEEELAYFDPMDVGVFSPGVPPESSPPPRGRLPSASVQPRAGPATSTSTSTSSQLPAANDAALATGVVCAYTYVHRPYVGWLVGTNHEILLQIKKESGAEVTPSPHMDNGVWCCMVVVGNALQVELCVKSMQQRCLQLYHRRPADYVRDFLKIDHYENGRGAPIDFTAALTTAQTTTVVAAAQASANIMVQLQKTADTFAQAAEIAARTAMRDAERQRTGGQAGAVVGTRGRQEMRVPDPARYEDRLAERARMTSARMRVTHIDAHGATTAKQAVADAVWQLKTQERVDYHLRPAPTRCDNGHVLHIPSPLEGLYRWVGDNEIIADYATDNHR